MSDLKIGYKRNVYRDEWMSKIFPDSFTPIVAEVGTHSGINADRIIDVMNPKKIYLIDIWKFPYADKVKATVYAKFKGNAKVVIMECPSTEAASRFDDGYFDFVYIDANHSYESVVQDLNAWYPKIKPSGIIAGHDYTKKYAGVRQAIHEFLKKNNIDDSSLFLNPHNNKKPNVPQDGPTDWMIQLGKRT